VVPRAVVRTESIGPFTLFVNEGHGWRYYARPTPGAATFTPDDVDAVRERQRALRQPEELEWIEELAPGVAGAARAAGMRVVGHPLMHLPAGAFTSAAPISEVKIAIVSPEADLALMNAVAHVGFGAPGTAVGVRDDTAFAEAIRRADPDTLAFTRERMRDGFTVMAAAAVAGAPVAVGSYQPADRAAEITGIATLPAFRRRGIGAALTSVLVAHALDAGIDTVFLSADDLDVARVYARLGFHTIGTAGAAEPDAR
jgi:ribosomal protein S18 acetylase RimI-like enzyme